MPNAPRTGKVARRQSAAAVSVALAILGSIALLAGACSSTSSTDAGQGSTTAPGASAPTVTEGGKIVYALPTTLDTFLPAAARWDPAAYVVAKALYDPLVALDDQHHVVPYLLQAIYPTAADFTAWALETRAGVRFADGTPFDADAVVANIEALRASPISSTPIAPISSVRKVAADKVEIAMTAPWANFPAAFATQQGFFVAPSQLDGGPGAAPVGTGPFQLVEGKAGDPRLLLRRNPTYWRAGLPHLDTVEFRTVADPDARRAGLESRDFDVMYTDLTRDLAQLAVGELTPGTHHVLDQDRTHTFQAELNTQSGPMADRSLRRALFAATDRQALIDTALDHRVPVANGPYGEGSPWASTAPAAAFDLDAARAGVARWREGHGGTNPRVRVLLVASNENLAVAQVLQQQWGAAGFDVALTGLDPAAFTSSLVTGDFDVVLIKFPWLPDPDNNYHYWSAATIGDPGALSINFARYTSPEAQAALDRGRRSVDLDARQEAYRALFADWADHAVYLWLYEVRFALVAADRVHGLDTASGPNGEALPQATTTGPFLATVWAER